MREHPDTTAIEPGSAPLSPVAREGVIGRLGASDSLRARVMALQSQMLSMTEHHIQIVPVHRFAEGLYAREVTLPQGSTAVGYMHAQEHVCIISKGRVQIVTESCVEEISAPATLIIPAGRKNCVHALEETVWTTIHATPATTVAEAEALLILPDEDALCLS